MKTKSMSFPISGKAQSHSNYWGTNVCVPFFFSFPGTWKLRLSWILRIRSTTCCTEWTWKTSAVRPLSHFTIAFFDSRAAGHTGGHTCLFSWVQFKWRWCQCAGKSPYAPHPVSQKFPPTLPFETVPAFVWWTMDLSRPLKQDRLAPGVLSLSLFRQTLLCASRRFLTFIL